MSFFKEFKLPDAPIFADFSVNICEYGAQENDMQKNMEALNTAISVCSENGGGTVVVPAGRWKTSAIHLKNNVNLHLEEGAVLCFSTEYTDYLPVVFGYRGGMRLYCVSHFIYAYKCKNIALTGKGILEGNGSAWWGLEVDAPGMTHLQKANKERLPLNERTYDTRESGVRPEFLQFVECENVLVEGVTFKNSPSWTVHPVMCRNVVIRGISVVNPFKAPNTDAIDIESCKCVLIEDCDMDTGDDIFCIKSGRDEDAWDYMTPCEDVVVRNCRGIGGCGGAAIGSETSGGVNNILFENCTFIDPRWGIRVKTRSSRGSSVENIFFKNIKIKNASIIGVDVVMEYLDYFEQLHYDDTMYNDPEVVAERESHIPVVKNISFENIECESSKLGLQLVGIKNHELENICFKDCNIASAEPLVIRDVKGIKTENLSFGYNFKFKI